MKLDDGMGYDNHQHTNRARLRVTWPVAVVAVLAVAVIALIASTIAGTRTPAQPAPAPGPAAKPATTSAPPASATRAPGPVGSTPSATPEGHDAEEWAGAPQQVWGTFEAFMAAWCSTDPAVRQQGFARTATADLARGLAETRPENVITANRTRVTVVGAGPYSEEFRVWFEQVATSVHVILIADPGSPHGWRVTRIEKRGD